MRVEALYRDGHKEQIMCPSVATLKQVVDAAKEVYDRAPIKFLKVVDDAKSNRGNR